MARSDHSGHDLPHTEVRVCRAAPSKMEKGSEEEGGGCAGVRKEEEGGGSAVSHSRVCGFRERGSVLLLLVVQMIACRYYFNIYTYMDCIVF